MRKGQQLLSGRRLCVKASVKAPGLVVLAFSKTLGDSSVFKASMIEEKARPNALCLLNHMTQNYHD
jgi:hypothetical protein